MKIVRLIVIRPETARSGGFGLRHFWAFIATAIIPSWLGPILNSTPLQWVGAIWSIAWAIALIIALLRHETRAISVAEAREELDKLERDQ